MLSLRQSSFLLSTFLLAIHLVGCNKSSNSSAPATSVAAAPPLPNALSEADAQRLVTGSAVANVRFGSRYVLIAVVTNLTPVGLKLDLAWQSLAGQIRSNYVPIHIVDSEGKILAQADYKFDKDQGEVVKDARWLDSLTIPYEKLVGATHVALGILHPDETWELADSGQRDWDNRRLLFPLPPNLPKESSLLGGNFEIADCTTIVGWAWNKNEPNSPVSVEIIVDGQVLTNIAAGEYREDLAAGGVGNGNHGFRLNTPSEIKDGKSHMLSVRVAGAPFWLNNSPKSLSCQH